MGIYHFAPVGTSPGAVTCALSYLKQNKDSFAVRGHIVESILLFASPDVRDGMTKIRECIYNEYMTLKAQKTWKMANILDVIVEFIKSEIADVMANTGTVYCCVVDPNDYDSCFEIIAKTALYFSPPGHTGKYIWANLTGGTNVLNAALLQVALLSGLISRVYYTFIPRDDDKRYLQPVKDEPGRFGWDEVPFIKTSFDNVYHAILQILKDSGKEWCLDEDLLGRLKQASWEYLGSEDRKTIDKIDIQKFRQEWLNKLDGRELERQVSPDGTRGHAVRLSDAGNRLIVRIESPLFQALVQRGKGVASENTADLTKDLDIIDLLSKA